jgi:hypothetical protein
MGDDRTIRSGLRRRASCAGAAFYFRCLPRRGHGTRAQWMGGSVPHSRGHFSSFVSLNRWCTFFLGLSPLGVNAAVVGLLLTALYTPVWTSAIQSPADFGLGLVAFGLLMFWKCPPWVVVALTAAGGELIARI